MVQIISIKNRAKECQKNHSEKIVAFDNNGNILIFKDKDDFFRYLESRYNVKYKQGGSRLVYDKEKGIYLEEVPNSGYLIYDDDEFYSKTPPMIGCLDHLNAKDDFVLSVTVWKDEFDSIHFINKDTFIEIAQLLKIDF